MKSTKIKRAEEWLTKAKGYNFHPDEQSHLLDAFLSGWSERGEADKEAVTEAVWKNGSAYDAIQVLDE